MTESDPQAVKLPNVTRDASTFVRVIRTLLRFGRRQPAGLAGLAVIVVLVVVAGAADWIATYDPVRLHPGEELRGPGERYLLGTDHLGRDVFSRIVYGSRISLTVGIIAVSIATIGGTIIGVVSGYYRGPVDMVLQRIVDAAMAFPGLILALAIVAALGSDIKNVMIAIGITTMPGMARVVRSAVLSVSQSGYVESARAVGAPDSRILVFHVLPNIMAPVIVLVTIGLGGAIVAEASLSFLGLGTPPPDPSWGGMLAGSGRAYLERSPVLLWAPAAAIGLVVLGFNFLGDAMRDEWDPRLRGSR